jgi:hypothetical protein
MNDNKVRYAMDGYKFDIIYANLTDHGAIFSHFVICATLVTCIVASCLWR